MKPDKPIKLEVRPFRYPPSNTVVKDPHFVKWSQSFSSLSVEVGCGVGYHPLQLAKQYPDRGIVAIERTQLKFEKFAKRLKTHGNPSSIFPVFGDGRIWLPLHLAPATVDSFHFVYPNPYPKSSQANKRWHRNPLMHFILETLKPMGTLHFATNESWLFEECLLYMTEFWGLSVDSKTTVQAPQENYLSHFEKKYLERGQTGYHVVFQKPIG